MALLERLGGRRHRGDVELGAPEPSLGSQEVPETLMVTANDGELEDRLAALRASGPRRRHTSPVPGWAVRQSPELLSPPPPIFVRADVHHADGSLFASL